jgi:hypothetical protein
LTIFARLTLSAMALLAMFGSACVTVKSDARTTLTEVSGGGCPPGGSVVLTTASGRALGSVAADDQGAFRIGVELAPDADPKHPLINVECGPTVVTVAFTVVDEPADNKVSTWIGLAIGAILIALVAARVVRRRWITTAATEDEDRT